MSKRKCVELTAIYSDGSVERWDGKSAQEVLNRAAFADGAGMRGAYYSDPITSRPLRRVTVVRGRWDPGSYDEHPAIVNQDDEGTYMGQLLPDETTARVGSVTGPRCDFRICVEAVPVDEVKP